LFERGLPSVVAALIQAFDGMRLAGVYVLSPVDPSTRRLPATLNHEEST
jgi:hypothetical protein